MPGLCHASTCDLHIASNGAELVQNVYNVLERALRTCGGKQIIVGLSGGGIVPTLMEVLPSLNEDYLERVRFIFCDEYRVPFDHPDSTYGQYAKFVLPRLQPTVDKDQFLCINPYLKTDECAKEYETKLQRIVGGSSQWPEIDVVLLGVGEDGHICSLFPGHPVLMENRSWVAPVTDSPKTLLHRVTLTLPVLNHARNIVFIATGSAKAAVVKKVLETSTSHKHHETMPAAMVDPVNYGTRMHWIVDKSAASMLAANLAN